ncbi:MAG: hypothetical protein AAGC92_02535 [Pseudomonadota bacterium]
MAANAKRLPWIKRKTEAMTKAMARVTGIHSAQLRSAGHSQEAGCVMALRHPWQAVARAQRAVDDLFSEARG